MGTGQVMNELKNIKSYVRSLYKVCVESVNPKFLISNELKVNDQKLVIRDREYELKRNCYVIGFGKAVLDMAYASEALLGNHIKAGAISIPEGMVSQNKKPPLKTIKVFEGAKDNISDGKALEAAKNIVKIIEPLTDQDILLVLISGGGSALLPYPVPPVTLQDKLNVTKQLAEAGANIIEINAVRKRLSLLKGGKLIKKAYPAQVVSLVLSDIVDDKLEFIASGPTVPDKLPPSIACDVLRKYGIIKEGPPCVVQLLEKFEPDDETNYFSYTQNHIIGNNQLALSGGEEAATKDGFLSKVMTNRLEGHVHIVAEALAKFTSLLCQVMGRTINSKVFEDESWKLIDPLGMTKENLRELSEQLSRPTKQKICLFFGGETTVIIKGKGKGGRNQELALIYSLFLDNIAKTVHVIDLFNVVLLSAGTDGIDGPTDAAGAIAYNGQSILASMQQLSLDNFIKNNDSYNYYSVLNGGEDIIKTGFTGTNVMDVVILTIQSKV